jgi:hypothetical protein
MQMGRWRRLRRLEIEAFRHNDGLDRCWFIHCGPGLEAAHDSLRRREDVKRLKSPLLESRILI